MMTHGKASDLPIETWKLIVLLIRARYSRSKDQILRQKLPQLHGPSRPLIKTVSYSTQIGQHIPIDLCNRQEEMRNILIMD